MKQYTHAWLAFMAIKRLECSAIPAEYRDEAQKLVKWFRDYRDFVIEGAWLPDTLIKDNSTGHIIKHEPSTNGTSSYGILPNDFQMYKHCITLPSYKKMKYVCKSGNLPDRVEALSHSIVDNFKILRYTDRGNPIAPSSNHIAMRFFMLSHYIADAHMPLHCDKRPFTKIGYDDIHAYIELKWEQQVKQSYLHDTKDKRFKYDQYGYPQTDKITPLMEAVEKEILTRPFEWDWTSSKKNAGAYVEVITHYSFLMSYHLIPEGYNVLNMSYEIFDNETEFGQNFDHYSFMILSDAIDTIAKVWLHDWARYRSFALKKDFSEAKKIISNTTDLSIETDDNNE